MIDLFHIIEDGVAILHRNGVFRQAKIYRRGDCVYAAWAAGFIKLLGGAGTSVPNVSWYGVEGPGVSYQQGKAPKWVEA